MSTHQTFICQYCITNINEVGAIKASEYAVTSESNSCTFCFCEYPEPFILLDNSDENITRLKKLLMASNNEYDYTHNYH